MAISDLNVFLHDFFKAHHCEITQNTDGILTIQLSETMDKALMNRPFYWHYIKSIGQQGEPMTLTLITNPNKRNENGEWIHFGSPRLQQIINYLKQHERYTKLYQQIQTNDRTPLFPWLVTNMQISYIGKQKKSELFSIGLNLVNGMMQTNFMDYLSKLSLQNTISDFCYTLSPLIKPLSGFRRIENVLEQYINSQSHDWARESEEALQTEVQLLEHFYDEKNKETLEQMEKEKNEIMERYQPKITFHVVNGGIFYLQHVKPS